MSQKTTILLCQCQGGQQLDESVYTTIAGYLLGLDASEQVANQPGTDIAIISDLCHWAIREKQLLQKLTLAGNVVLVSACSERAILNLLNYAGLSTDSVHINRYINYRLEPTASTIEQLREIIGQNGQVTSVHNFSLNYKPASMAWFPIIDYEHCTQCRKCENFCLFGVYKNSAGKVTVDKPTKCKPYCPACARICPHNAVLFPKHDQPEINGGSFSPEGISDNSQPTSIKGSDLMNLLRNRNALTDKATELGIPKQVLDGLTPDEVNKIINKK